MTDALHFLVVIEALGLVALPLARLVLGRLPGAGLGLAKPLGLLLASWLVLLAGSAGLEPLGLPVLLGAAVVIALAAVAAHRHRSPAGGGGRAGRDPLAVPLWLAGELVFVLAFAGMALVVAHAPDVWGTEKPMDMAFLAALGEAPRLPPQDPWLAGEALDYYYLGHLGVALLAEVTGVEPTRGYNLGVALHFALAASAAFAVGAALWAAVRGDGARRGALLGGLLALVLAVVAGNLAGVRALLRAEGGLRAYDWFGVSRVVPDTINEFPAFSFLLGDLHAHVLVVPWLLLCAAFALQLCLAGPRGPVAGAGAALALGALYATNAWSAPLGAGLLALALAGWARDPRSAGRRGAAAWWGSGVLLGAVVLWLPFHLTYEPPTGGLAAVTTRRGLLPFLGDQLLLHGLFVVLAGLAWEVAGARHRRPSGRLAAGTLVLLLGAAAIGFGGPALLLLGLLLALRPALDPGTRPGLRAGAGLLAGALACLLTGELIYVRDEFDGSALARMNTVFKLGHEAWLVLALGCVGLLAAAAPARRRTPRVATGVVLGLVLLAGAVYPVAGIWARTDGFARPATLDGLGWLRSSAPGDPGAIAWLRRNAAPGAVVLETTGPDYSPAGHGRIATFSGRPTVLGWAGHERQWGHDAGTRAADVAALYRTPDPAAARALLRRYEIAYVVVGPLERADHGPAGPARSSPHTTAPTAWPPRSSGPTTARRARPPGTPSGAGSTTLRAPWSGTWTPPGAGRATRASRPRGSTAPGA